MGKLNEKDKANALNEVRILASIDAPNIIEYKECFFDDQSCCLCLIMELCDGGDLLQLIDRKIRLREQMSEPTIWRFFI